MLPTLSIFINTSYSRPLEHRGDKLRGCLVTQQTSWLVGVDYRIIC